MIMWKVRFLKDNYKTVKKIHDKVTVVELTGCLQLPIKVIQSIPSDVFIWIVYHNNPRVSINLSSEYIVIRAKGKATRCEEDADNPVLAERIAECKAKMKIYGFVSVMLCKYINYYVELMVGKKGSMVPMQMGDNYLCANHEKYDELWNKEYKHLIKLLEGAGKWD